MLTSVGMDWAPGVGFGQLCQLRRKVGPSLPLPGPAASLLHLPAQSPDQEDPLGEEGALSSTVTCSGAMLAVLCGWPPALCW
jgi:hypothetical protein